MSVLLLICCCYVAVMLLLCCCPCCCTYTCCALQVQLPHVDWGRVMDTDMAHAPSFKVAPGYERLHMPAGVQVRLQLAVGALQHLTQPSSQHACVSKADVQWGGCLVAACGCCQ